MSQTTVMPSAFTLPTEYLRSKKLVALAQTDFVLRTYDRTLGNTEGEPARQHCVLVSTTKWQLLSVERQACSKKSPAGAHNKQQQLHGTGGWSLIVPAIINDRLE